MAGGQKRILSVQAHPDDAEILAGGALALLAAQGHHITIVTMTPGDCGANDYAPDVIAAIRRKEAAAAAAMIGAEYRCAEFRDLSIYVDDASRRRITAVLRETRPDIVITSFYSDYLCDHEATSLLVRDACFAAPAGNYAAPGCTAAPLEAIPHLYYTLPVGSMNREGQLVEPDFVVNVASVFQLKRDMLAAHDSQRRWLMQHHGMDDYLETMEEWTRACGQRAGITYGEGFRHYKGHPYPESPLLEELLGEELLIRPGR